MIEFSDLVQYLARLGLSVLLGLLIGYEREGQNKPAGVRDVALITLGATLFGILSLEIMKLCINIQSNVIIRYDMGRIIAYTIVSIGFLGSGVIIQNKNKLEGITTAGSLWCAVATGLFCGIGNYILATVSALFVYLILKLKQITVTFEKRQRRIRKCRKIISK